MARRTYPALPLGIIDIQFPIDIINYEKICNQGSDRRLDSVFFQISNREQKLDIFNAYIWLAVFGVMGAVVIGALLYAWRQRRRLLIRQSIPANWPMKRRLPVTPEERQLWQWMCTTFPAHRVSLKMPLTRFTQPLNLAQGRGLYKLLGGVHCTFTVCTPDGLVVGCADVMDAGGLASKNRLLKKAVLTRCGIAYCVLQPACLPSATDIRSEFLGQKPVPQAAPQATHSPAQPALSAKSREERYQKLEEALMAEARVRLSTALDRQRRIRESEFSPLMTDMGRPAPARRIVMDGEDSERQNLLAGWQPNSFLAPLER